MGKTLSEHPDQRRQIVENPKLIPQAIEELLRFEPPGPFMARYVTNDIEYYGQKIPKGSALVLMVACANRDDRRFTNGDSRSEEHTSELQSLISSSYAVFCLKKKTTLTT